MNAGQILGDPKVLTRLQLDDFIPRIDDLMAHCKHDLLN